MYRTIILTFVVTALWDLVLRAMSQRKLAFAGIEKMKWVRVLEPFFEKHTILASALIAGFAGASTAAIVLKTTMTRHQPLYLVYILLISGLFGVPMRYVGLFPHLKTHYYDELGILYSTLTDIFSGFVVAVTLWTLSLANIQ